MDGVAGVGSLTFSPTLLTKTGSFACGCLLCESMSGCTKSYRWLSSACGGMVPVALDACCC